MPVAARARGFARGLLFFPPFASDLGLAMNAGLLTLLCPLFSGQPASPPVLAPVAAAVGKPTPAPVLATRVLAPAGVRVTAYPATPIARTFEAPAVLGMRPGYIYRLELSTIPAYPGRSLFPEVEICGTIVPRPRMNYMDWQAPLLFTTGDIDRAMAGTMVTKIVYLEDPEKAIPADATRDAPIELTDDSVQEAVRTAIENGRLVAVIRLGDKVPSVELLRAMAIPGTILLPGETILRAPAVPPVIPYYACPLFDPILGPKGPKEECIVDGGDKLSPLGVGPRGIGGLDPTDVGVEFSVGGKRRVTTSNIVCICSPRFVVRKVDIGTNGVDARMAIAAHETRTTTVAYRERVGPMSEIGRERPTELLGRRRPMAYLAQLGPSSVTSSSRLAVIFQIDGVKEEASLVEPEEITGPFLCPLRVTKSVDPSGPVPAGAVVTFTIEYRNTGTKPISDVVINDSLSGRLEYIPGSQETDRAANFTVSENEAGSAIVRWELPGALLPGQGGVVRFRARVR